MPIPNPVPGGTFTDSYGAPRSGGRKHAGVDIFAAKGSPVLAPVAGKVGKVDANTGLGGNAVWVNGADGRAYYFAHLDRIDAAVGQAVTPGTPLGTVGDTGNASGGSPHLHFSINGNTGNENPVVNPFLVIDKAMKFIGATDPFGRPITGGSLTDAKGTPVETVDSGGGAASGPQTGDVCEGCLIKFPGFAGVGDFCALSRCQGRAVVGGLALVGGGVIMLAGVLVLAAYSIKSVGLKAAIGNVPGTQAVASRVTPAGRRASAEAQDAGDVRAAQGSAQMTAAQDRQEAAERRMVRRRQTSSPGPRAA